MNIKIYKCYINSIPNTIYCTKIIKNGNNIKFCNIIEHIYTEKKTVKSFDDWFIKKLIDIYYKNDITDVNDYIKNYQNYENYMFETYRYITNKIIETNNKYTISEITKDNYKTDIYDSWIFTTEKEATNILNKRYNDIIEANTKYNKLVFFTILFNINKTKEFNKSIFRRLFYNKDNWINKKYIVYNCINQLDQKEYELYNLIFKD